ncbi:MAG: TIGR02281 family clan AA aspartic protease [Alsobacter sp.]
MFRNLSLIVCVAAASVAAVEGLKRLPARGATPAPAKPAEASGESRGMMVLPEDGRGHFLAPAFMNGIMIQTVVDTGASVIALSLEDAARAGIFPNAGDYKVSLATANGVLAVAPVTLREVRLGGIVQRDVEAVVLPAGKLKVSLLGMSFLRRFSAMQVSKGSLLLKE